MAFGARRLVFIVTGKDELTPLLKKISGQAMSTSEKFAAAGRLMTKAITLPVLAGAAASVKLATDFESSMKRVQTQAGASAGDVKTLSKQILNLGLYAEQSPTKLADAMFHLKSVGMDNVNAMKALKVSSDLAAVGQSDLEETTTALAGAWRSGIKGSSDFGKAAATLNAIVGSGNMKMQDLVDAIGTGFLPTARSFGVSLRDVGAALALMTDEGIPAQVAATRLRTAMTMMGAPTDKAIEALSSIGIKSTDLAKKMRGPGGLPAAITFLHDKIQKSGVSATVAAMTIARAFGGARTGSAILTLLNNYNVLNRKQAQINATVGKFGPAVAAQRKTAQAQFALLRSSLEVTAVRIGTVLLPVVISLVKGINRIVTAFANLPAVARNAIMIMLGIAAVVGPILVLVAKLYEVAKVLRLAAAAQWLLNIAMDANPIGIIIVAVAALVTAFIVLWLKFKGFRDFIKSYWPELVGMLAGPFGVAAALIIQHWSTVKGAVIAAFHAVVNAGRVAWRAISGAAMATWNAIMRGLNAFRRTTAFHVLAVAARLAFLTIKVIAQITWDLVSGFALLAWALMKPVFKFIAFNARLAFRVLSTVARAAWLVTSTVARIAWGILRPIFGFIGTVARTNWRITSAAARLAWQATTAVARGAWNTVIKPVFGFIVNVAKKVWGAVSHLATVAWNVVRTGIRALLNVILGVFGTIIHAAADAFGWVPKLGPKLKDAAHKFDQFRSDVNAALSGVHGRKVSVQVSFNASGGGKSMKAGMARGGPVYGAGTATSDSIPAMLSNREYVMKAAAHKTYGTGAMDAVNRGKAVITYASGGPVGKGINVDVVTPDRQAITSSIMSIIRDMAKKFALSAGGNAVVALAKSFVGRVPYVWGGETPRGWDCSGMVSWLYEHFGYLNGRMDAAGLQRWGRRSGPTPGGMVFFGNPAHHVGIVYRPGQMISALGRQYGTIVSSDAGNSGFEIPPMGLGAVGGYGGGANNAVNIGRELDYARGWARYWPALYKLWMRESGWNSNARNPSSGAAGIPQDISGSFHGGAWGQILWGLNYIAHRYGNPGRAWAHELAFGWYKKGGPVNAHGPTSFDTGRGMLRPGYNLAYNGTGRNEFLRADSGSSLTINIYPKGPMLGTKKEVGQWVSEALQEFSDKGGKLPAKKR